MRSLFLLLLCVSLSFAQTPSGEMILKRIDANIGSQSKISIGEMRIQERREVRTVRMKTWMKDMRNTYTEFLAPPRDKGMKMLKLVDQLWTYTPSTDRIMLISGHMLRQSVMGSDLSYEDMLEDPSLSRMYDASVAGDESIGGRACWILSLKAKAGIDVSYESRKVWVDKERFVVMKEERFARSGMLLKTTEVRKVIRAEGKWVAADVVIKDALKSGSGTEFIVESITFDEAIPSHYFTKAVLRR